MKSPATLSYNFKDFLCHRRGGVEQVSINLHHGRVQHHTGGGRTSPGCHDRRLPRQTRGTHRAHFAVGRGQRQKGEGHNPFTDFRGGGGSPWRLPHVLPTRISPIANRHIVSIKSNIVMTATNTRTFPNMSWNTTLTRRHGQLENAPKQDARKCPAICRENMPLGVSQEIAI